jgi:hypothetical protein
MAPWTVSAAALGESALLIEITPQRTTAGIAPGRFDLRITLD